MNKNVYIRNTFLFFCSAIIIVFFIPKNIPTFSYKYSKGRIWNYETLFAPFDFLIKKSNQDIDNEIKNIEKDKRLYYKYNIFLTQDMIEEFDKSIDILNIEDSNKIKDIFKLICEKGIIKDDEYIIDPNKDILISIIKGTNEIETLISVIFSEKTSVHYFERELLPLKYNQNLNNRINEIFISILKPNLFFDQEFTNLVLNEKKDKVVLSKGKIIKNQKIVEKGQILTPEIYDILNSLSQEYKDSSLSGNKGILVIIGYIVIIFSIISILNIYLLFFTKNKIFVSTKKILIIITLLLLGFFLALFFSSIDYLNKNLIYIFPICIIPIITRTFFNQRISIFLHIIILSIISLFVDNNFQFIFINILTGIISVLGVKEIHKRANIFINISIISLSYIILYYSFLLIQNGEILGPDLEYILFFCINGILTLFALPLIYIFEKIFREVSDVTLLELSDTNNNVLRELSTKAPGTFQHSLQVANIAENISRQIKGVNSLLTRVGALYHDIGKLHNPEYFTENQYSENPHNDISPLESAKIIINHVKEGLVLADKYNLPTTIKNFIKTHHGTSLVYFFYKKAVDILGVENVDKLNFSYSGPIPFSKEMAVVMISDSIEASSKSLKNATEEDYKNLIEKIINNMIVNNQFDNVDITFKEIDIIKKISFDCLKNIYKGRIKYPD